jgi:hypothetical protein
MKKPNLLNGHWDIYQKLRPAPCAAPWPAGRHSEKSIKIITSSRETVYSILNEAEERKTIPSYNNLAAKRNSEHRATCIVQIADTIKQQSNINVSMYIGNVFIFLFLHVVKPTARRNLTDPQSFLNGEHEKFWNDGRLVCAISLPTHTKKFRPYKTINREKLVSFHRCCGWPVWLLWLAYRNKNRTEYPRQPSEFFFQTKKN